MSDLYLKIVNTSLGKTAAQSLGLPSPTPLKRWTRAAQPFIEGNVLIGSASGGISITELGNTISAGAAMLHHASKIPSLTDSARAGTKAVPLDLTTELSLKFSALVFDATGIQDTVQLRALYDFFHPAIRQLAGNGRILVVGLDSASTNTPAQAAAQRSLEGFVRSVGKEVGKKGATANLIWMAPTASRQLDSTVRFFLSSRSAYVSGQCVRITRSTKGANAISPTAPLRDKVALVTGASRGIGESIADTLARDGATVIALDVPAAMEQLEVVASRIKGNTLPCDITAADAPEIIANFVQERFGGLDIIVHNAGITRDKTLGNMPEHFWDMAIAVNLTAEELINEELMSRELLRANGRIVCVSSISGIAGNFGQTNYATSKSGVIGYVEALAKLLKEGRTINAVAPGFIETQMTAAIPFAIREAGRRMNSLSQGGLPIDVAETIAWYCNPTSAGVNGNTVRVCGQSIVGR